MKTIVAGSRYKYRDPVHGQLDAFILVDFTGLAVYIESGVYVAGRRQGGQEEPGEVR